MKKLFDISNLLGTDVKLYVPLTGPKIYDECCKNLSLIPSFDVLENCITFRNKSLCPKCLQIKFIYSTIHPIPVMTLWLLNGTAESSIIFVTFFTDFTIFLDTFSFNFISGARDWVKSTDLIVFRDIVRVWIYELKFVRSGGTLPQSYKPHTIWIGGFMLRFCTADVMVMVDDDDATVYDATNDTRSCFIQQHYNFVFCRIRVCFVCIKWQSIFKVIILSTHVCWQFVFCAT